MNISRISIGEEEWEMLSAQLPYNQLWTLIGKTDIKALGKDNPKSAIQLNAKENVNAMVAFGRQK